MATGGCRALLGWRDEGVHPYANWSVRLYRLHADRSVRATV